MVGSQILNYQVKSIIGDGGMGVVYLAEHVKLGRKVAIKVLHSHLASNESIRQRFVNEAKTMSELQHPNIVGLLDYHEDEFGLYLIMEYIEGTPLDEYIKKISGPIPEKHATFLFKQTLSALEYAHEKGVVHRDIKPSNIMITKNNTIKVLDFGIAKLIGNANHKLTKTGALTGTIYYMSPEQVKGKDVDHLSDIYSLGITFYQMLTGYNPYSELTTEYEIFENIVKVPLADPRTIYPAVSEKMCNIIKRATEKDPGSRFKNCKEFIIALDQENFQTISDDKASLDWEKTKVSEKISLSTYPSEKKRSFWLAALIPFLICLIGYGFWHFVNKANNGAKETTTELVDVKSKQSPEKEVLHKSSPNDSITIKKVSKNPQMQDPNSPISLSVRANNLDDFRFQLKQKSNELMKNKNYRPVNCSFNTTTFTFKCSLEPEASSFTKITLVYSPAGSACESCANTLLKNPGSEVLVDVSDASYHYNVISIAE